MNNSIILSFTSVLLTGAFLSTAVMAQTPVPDHPRVNEIDHRLEQQQNRIDTGVQNGQINATQEMHDEKRDAKVAQELSKDEAKHNGHITKREQRRMNRQLDANSKHIHHQRKAAETK